MIYHLDIGSSSLESIFYHKDTGPDKRLFGILTLAS